MRCVSARFSIFLFMFNYHNFLFYYFYFLFYYIQFSCLFSSLGHFSEHTLIVVHSKISYFSFGVSLFIVLFTDIELPLPCLLLLIIPNSLFCYFN